MQPTILCLFERLIKLEEKYTKNFRDYIRKRIKKVYFNLLRFAIYENFPNTNKFGQVKYF